jgi:transposase
VNGRPLQWKEEQLRGDATVTKDLTADLTEELYGAIAPHLPVRPAHRRKGGRPFLRDDKGALRGILYLLREGCKWQSIPREALPGCPSGSTCWRRFKEWTAAGVWDKAHLQLLDLLGEQGVLNLERIVVDSASCRAQKGGRTPEPTPPTGPSWAANATC